MNVVRKIFNRWSNIKSRFVTWFYSLIFKKTGNFRIWGNIKVIYPQNISIGNNCSINHGCLFNAYNPIKIGDNVIISSNVSIISTGVNLQSWLNGEKGDIHIRNNGVYIGNEVWIGANSLIMGGGTNKR